MECRSLKCWNTEEIESIYSKNRITRKELIAGIDGLWDLIADHQNRCGYHKVYAFVEIANEKAYSPRDLKDIMETIRYDYHVRDLVVKKMGVDPEIIDFLFGLRINSHVATAMPNTIKNP